MDIIENIYIYSWMLPSFHSQLSMHKLSFIFNQYLNRNGKLTQDGYKNNHITAIFWYWLNTLRNGRFFISLSCLLFLITVMVSVVFAFWFFIGISMQCIKYRLESEDKHISRFGWFFSVVEFKSCPVKRNIPQGVNFNLGSSKLLFKSDL